MALLLSEFGVSLSAIYPLFSDHREWFRYDFHILNRDASLLPVILNVLSNLPLKSSRWSYQARVNLACLSNQVSTFGIGENKISPLPFLFKKIPTYHLLILPNASSSSFCPDQKCVDEKDAYIENPDRAINGWNLIERRGVEHQMPKAKILGTVLI